MKSDIFFSVVIPTYNRADLIMETLDSVFGQSYPNYEILVVDNHSTDNTVQLLAPLVQSNKIRFFRHDRNYERSRSRNTGMEHAQGDFLTFLDSDDFMYKDCLKDAAVFVRENPGARFFHNLYELVGNDRKRIYEYDFPSLSNQYKALAGGNFISCIGGFIHKEIYKSYRFTEDVRMIGSEDYEIWFEILARYPLGRINKVNSGIREHPQRSVNNGTYLNLEFQKNALVAKIENDKLLKAKFGPYLKRLESSFTLQQVIISNAMKRKRNAIKLLLRVIYTDFSILLTLRFYKVLYNTIKL